MRITECSFCDERAKFISDGVTYCHWHMIFLYLALTADDDRIH